MTQRSIATAPQAVEEMKAHLGRVLIKASAEPRRRCSALPPKADVRSARSKNPSTIEKLAKQNYKHALS
jgi:hypothetical protein